MIAYLIPRKRILSKTDILIVFDGDSLTRGFDDSGIEQYYPGLVHAWLQTNAKSTEFYSYGVGGQSTEQMIADASSQIYSKVNNNKKNILVAWEDVNAILNNGRTAQQNYDDFETYFNGAKSAGFDYCILITGYYPRTPYNNSAWNEGVTTPLDVQHDYFELVKNASNTVWDIHIDLRDAENIGGARNQAVNAIYFGDSVHLFAAGYDVVAQKVIDSIQYLF